MTDRKRISPVVKLLAVHEFSQIVLMVKFGLTSYEELPPALLEHVVWGYCFHEKCNNDLIDKVCA